MGQKNVTFCVIFGTPPEGQFGGGRLKIVPFSLSHGATLCLVVVGSMYLRWTEVSFTTCGEDFWIFFTDFCSTFAPSFRPTEVHHTVREPFFDVVSTPKSALQVVEACC